MNKEAEAEMDGLTVEDSVATVQAELVLQFFLPLRAVRVLYPTKSASVLA